MNINWPILYPDILLVNNLNSSVGIATMWTEREAVAKMLGNLEYCVIGNLYSGAGITPMIRNIYAKPTIKTLILWGADLSGSGQALDDFFNKGVDSENKIVTEKETFIEKEIDKASLELLRKNVRFINLKGKPVDVLKKAVKEYSKEEAIPFAKPKDFPIRKPKPFTFPSEQVGFRVSNTTVAQTWLKVLNTIIRYGRNKKTRYTQTNELKEVLNLMAVITDDDPDNFYFPHYLPFTKKEMESYYPQVLTAKKFPNIAYTYGQRLRDHDGVDQIQEIINLIKRRPFAKKMVAFTANVKDDWGNVNKGDTPCLTQVLVSVQDDSLFFTVHFRSQDMVHGWPRNMFSLRKLQKLILDESGAGLKLGPITIVTHSAHIYSDDYELVEKILKENYEKELGFAKNAHFEFDGRGNYVIELVRPTLIRDRKNSNIPNRSLIPIPGRNEWKPGDGRIVVKLFAPNGGLLLKQWEGQTAFEVYMQITDWEFLSLPSHAVYLGSELQRAEEALFRGEFYSQDPAAGDPLRKRREEILKKLKSKKKDS